MKVSVITPLLNGEKTLKDCIDSVKFQTYENIEHIVIDGGSKDKSLDVLEKCKSNNLIILHQKSTGLYPAINEAMKAASGDIITVLNCDDFFSTIKTVEYVVNFGFLSSYVDIVYGDLVCVSARTGHVVRDWRSDDFEKGAFNRGWSPPHPGFFYRSRVHDIVGGYCEELRIAADVKFMHDALEVNCLKSNRLPTALVQMRSGGISSGIRSKIIINIEILRFLKLKFYNINTYYFIIRKLHNRLGQLNIRCLHDR